MNRFNNELKLVTRELAGALLPALRFATDVLGRFRRWLEKLSGPQQDMLMYGTLGVLGLKGTSVMSRNMFGTGLADAIASGLGRGRGRGPVGAGAGEMVGGGPLGLAIMSILYGIQGSDTKREIGKQFGGPLGEYFGIGTAKALGPLQGLIDRLQGQGKHRKATPMIDRLLVEGGTTWEEAALGFANLEGLNGVTQRKPTPGFTPKEGSVEFYLEKIWKLMDEDMKQSFKRIANELDRKQNR
jgi:hypothetical protein